MTALLYQEFDKKTKASLIAFKEQILPLCGSRETSNLPDQWTPEDPLHGHSMYVACFIQEKYKAFVKKGFRSVNGKNEKRYFNFLYSTHFDMLTETSEDMFFTAEKEQPEPYDMKDMNPLQKKRYAIFKENVLRVMKKKKFRINDIIRYDHAA